MKACSATSSGSSLMCLEAGTLIFGSWISCAFITVGLIPAHASCLLCLAFLSIWIRRSPTSALKDFLKKTSPQDPIQIFPGDFGVIQANAAARRCIFIQELCLCRYLWGAGSVLHVRWFPAGIPPNLTSRFPSANSPFRSLRRRHLERSFERVLFTKCMKTPTQMSLWVS